jgi:hypothetical protein
LCLIAELALAAGPINGFTIGNWQGGAYTNDQSGEFSHCAASTYYTSGVSFFVAITKDLQWNIALTSKNWVLTPKEQVPFKMIFDGKNNFDVFSVAQSPEMLIASMPKTSLLVNIFKSSQYVDINVKGSYLKFKLDGTSKLLPALEECVNSSRLAVRSQPAAPQVPSSFASRDAPQTSDGSGGQYEIEALKMATNFLLRAEIRDAKLLDRREVPISFASYNATWRSDDLIGGVKILPVDPSMKGIDVAAMVVSEDAKDCRGKFASGRVSELVDSDVVFRGFSTCEDSSGLRTSQYFIVPRRSSGFALFSVSTNGKIRDTKIGQEEQLTSFRRAALVSITQ